MVTGPGLFYSSTHRLGLSSGARRPAGARVEVVEFLQVLWAFEVAIVSPQTPKRALLQLESSMKTIAGLAFLSILAAGCQSNPFDGHNDRYSDLSVDDDALVYVPESKRSEIDGARTDCDQMRDRVTIAEHDVEQGKQELALAQDELDVSESNVNNAMTGLEVARNSNGDVRAAKVSAANTKIDSARARWHAAQSDVAYRAARVDQLDAQVQLAELRVKRAEAEVELAKAKAILELDRPESRDIAVDEFQACVDEMNAQVALAEVDTAAWEQKVGIRKDVFESHRHAREASSERDE